MIKCWEGLSQNTVSQVKARSQRLSNIIFTVCNFYRVYNVFKLNNGIVNTFSVWCSCGKKLSILFHLNNLQKSNLLLHLTMVLRPLIKFIYVNLILQESPCQLIYFFQYQDELRSYQVSLLFASFTGSLHNWGHQYCEWENNHYLYVYKKLIFIVTSQI